MRTCELREAKSRFSDVVDLTLNEGPQLVTRRGAEAVVVLAAEDYHRLVGNAPNLIDHLLKAPRGDALVITRSNELIRGFE
jgi:antitoxin Phd